MSPDGTRALTGSFDYSAILWDLAGTAPRQVLRLADHNGAVNAVAFVDGKRALTAGDDSIVRLWDLESGTLLHKFLGHETGSKIVGLSVSRDGTLAVSAGWDRTARLWNLATLSAGPVLTDHTGPVNAVVITTTAPPGTARHIYTASQDGQLRAFAEDGQFKFPVVRHGWGLNVMAPVRAVVTSRGDDLLVGALDGAAFVVDPVAGKVILDLPPSPRPILSVATLAEPGLVATGGGDGIVRLMRTDGTLVEEHKNPFGPVWALAIRPVTDGRPIGLYYGGLDDVATFWQAAPRAPFEVVDASQYPRRFQQTGKSGDDLLAKGELQFARKCSICHTLTPDSANRAGPTLHNIFGRRIATRPGYNYSPELETLDITWTAETIAKLFELGPDKFTPGSKMPLQVMSDKAERDALIAFLEIATK